MGTTTRGLPYPEPTDPIAQGADAIRRLAQNLDGRMIQVGSVTLTGDGTNSKAQAITYPVPFVGVPITVASVNNWNWLVGVGVLTATGCTFTIGRRDAATFTQAIVVSWIAMGQISPT